MKGLRSAASLLTTVPVGLGNGDRSDWGRAIPWFPIVGAVVGLGMAGTYATARLVLPPFLAAAVATGVGILVTGALHEDGLADTADALAGGRGREDALRILKDPSHGTFGVMAIVLSVLLRAGGLAVLDGWTALAVLPTVHALSRAAAAGLLGTLPPATNAGLGATYAGAATPRRLAMAAAAAVFIGALASGLWVIPAALLAASVGWVVGRLSVRKLGGITGDILGAAQQVSEVALVLLGAIFVTNGWPSPAWWR